MYPIRDELKGELHDIRDSGTYKAERIIVTPQAADIRVDSGAEVINFCANNYLGLADSPRLVAAAKATLDKYALGMASVRFICGTLDVHKELERTIADFHRKEDAILYAAAYDANVGLFEPFLDKRDAIISDALNHASIIDGVRLCKAARYRYAHDDMADLRARLVEAREASSRWTATSPSSTRSATSPTSSRPWSTSTSATPPASSVPAGAAPRPPRAPWTAST